MTTAAGGVAAPNGFRAAGVAAGIKEGSSKKDCALVVSDAETAVAGVFTTNVMKSPPVHHNAAVCREGMARGVFINSGNANAATGDQGHRDTATTASQVAAELGVDPKEICICSTGVIGVPLPMERIAQGVSGCVAALSKNGSSDAAHAIMTTDTVPKEFSTGCSISGRPVTIGAIAKGSGMVCPNMATMICILTTDATIDGALLKETLRAAIDVSFHQICIDNDLSTSDTVLVFANGQSGAPALTPGSGDLAVFAKSLIEICQTAAKALVRDGEGATKFVEIEIAGTESDEDAKTIARAIAQSQLCKTAFFGEDPNWGRIACAAGYAGIDFDPAALDISLNELEIAKGGLAANFEEEAAVAIMKRAEFSIRVSVGHGNGKARFWTSDLSHGYVSINADYRS